jgi:hypothetical protein
VGTNLVELGLVSEQDLARTLGKLHSLPFACGDLVPDPRALELVDLNHADQYDYLPMRVDSTRMSVAVVSPQDVETLDALAFKTGKRIVPVIIPEFRMNQLLRRWCKAFRPLRAIDMNVIRPARSLQGAEAEAEQGKGEDLISEEEFQSLYAQALRGGVPVGALAQEPVVDLVEVVEPEPVPEPPVVVGSMEPPPPPPETPLSFPEAQAELSRSMDREEVATAVLRFARGKWKRCLLLSVQGSLVTGWRGMGERVHEQAVRRIAISLRSAATFRLVRDTRAHYVGPVRRDGAAALFYKLLGGGFPTTAVILPLLVRGKLVHLLYVDNGPGELTPPDVGELLILSQSVGRSYEAMIRRRQGA